jgi:hypothetical protein
MSDADLEAAVGQFFRNQAGGLAVIFDAKDFPAGT